MSATITHQDLTAAAYKVYAARGETEGRRIVSAIIAHHAGPRVKLSALDQTLYEPVLAALTEAVDQHRPLQPWSYDQLEALPENIWLIGSEDKPVLLAGSLWLVFGKMKSGKTYLGLEQAFCVAFGLEFHGLPTVQGVAVYIVAEGSVKMHQRRIKALFKKYEKEMRAKGFTDLRAAYASKQFLLITSPVNLADGAEETKQGIAELLKEIKTYTSKPISVIYFDTWSRMLAASGSHSSDQEGVPQAIRGCDYIRHKLGCAVAIVAHVGSSKDAQDRPAGMHDLPGAIDGAMKAEKIGEGGGAWFVFKSVIQRHAEDGFQIFSTMAKNETGGVTLINRSGAEFKIDRVPDNCRRAFEVLQELGGVMVDLDKWRDAVKATDAIVVKDDVKDKAASWRSAWQVIKTRLVNIGAVEIAGDTVSINEKSADDD